MLLELILCHFSSDKGPSLRQLSSKSPELGLPLLRQNDDEAAEDEDEEQEITLHWRQRIRTSGGRAASAYSHLFTALPSDVFLTGMLKLLWGRCGGGDTATKTRKCCLSVFFFSRSAAVELWTWHKLWSLALGEPQKSSGYIQVSAQYDVWREGVKSFKGTLHLDVQQHICLYSVPVDCTFTRLHSAFVCLHNSNNIPADWTVRKLTIYYNGNCLV